jgi:putative membrane protein insertion efficiency factor
MIKVILIHIIKAYQLFISPLFGNNCRFYPTCSNYAIEAFKEYNTLFAIRLIILRILKCNPWGGSGKDLLPDKNAKNKN